MNRKARIGMAAAILIGVAAAILLYRKAKSFTTMLLGSNGTGGHKPPKSTYIKDPEMKMWGPGTINPDSAVPDPDQPPTDPGKVTRVTIVFSGMASVMPEAVGPLLKTIGAGKLGTMLSHGGGYQETGIKQIGHASPTLWTRIRAGLCGAKDIIETISPEMKPGLEGGGNPNVAQGSREVPGLGFIQAAVSMLGSFDEACRAGRCYATFDVQVDKANAAEFMLKSGLTEQIRQLEALTQLAEAAQKKFSTLVPVITLLATKA